MGGNRSSAKYIGYVPIVSLLVFGAIGASISDYLGLSDGAIAIPFAVAAFFVSRAVLRRYFAGDPSTSSA